MNNDLTQLKEWFWPLIITFSIILTGIIVQRLVIVYLQRISKKEKWQGGLVIISSLRGMIILISVLAGIYLGLSVSPLPANVLDTVQKLHKVFEIFIITFITARVLTGLLKAYTLREEGIKRSISLFNSIIKIVVYCIGGLIILQALNISITPIITALGVGGLAVALALQDTLSNLFAGVQLTATHVIKPGEYIILSSGEEGTVNDINWRYTTLITQSNNLVVIPNSKMASTIVTNYSLPAKNLDVSLAFGVSYDSDLDKVEKVTLQVAQVVMNELGVTGESPTFRFKEFGTAAINCSISITVHNFTQQYVMKHNLMKALYKQFKQEGIVIPYPQVYAVSLNNPLPNKS
ncbi:MAG TPA: mechanosensitive ion channel family protein [Bacteroidia bacterium]|jgi:small-conductance mechanosensitive channel|nr:mechanosensitive ion channel family protein [Bacteroidia bacterium]